jgi:DNA-binding SARP family transcriptional activator/tetratricopeptide (TPR) repeat protein
VIRLGTLGESVIETKGGRYGPEAELVFAFCVFMAAQRGRRVSRQAVLEVLWPRVSEERRRHNLRQLLYKLRRAGIPFEVDGTHVSLRSEDVQADYDVYYSARVAEGDAAVVEAPGGQFLAGYAPTFSPVFGEWVEERRSEVHAQMRRVQLAAVASLRQRGEWSLVDRLCRRVLELDPLNEEATLALAESTAMSGSKAAAVAMLDRYSEELVPGARELKLPASVLRRRISIKAQGAEAGIATTGRSYESQYLRQLWKAALGGNGCSCHISGEAGIGKTRLIVDLQTEASFDGATCVVVDASSELPLSLLHHLLPRLLAAPGSLGCAPESLNALRTFSIRGRPDTNAEVSADPNFRTGLLKKALLDLLDAVSDETPMVVAVEDVQSLDSASKSLLVSMRSWARSRPVLIISTSRERLSDPVPRDLQLLAVEPLSDDVARTLVLSRAGREKLPEEAVARCLSLARGNPYFLLELAGHYSSGLPIHRLPPTLEAIVRGSVETLSGMAKRVLQIAVLLGPLASLSRIEQVLGIPRLSLVEALDELELGRFCSLTRGLLQIQHPMVGDAALSSCSKSSLEVLHRGIAIQLKREIVDSNSSHVMFECLRHLRACGDHAGAAELVIECTQHMLASGLAPEAATLIEDAVTVSEQLNDSRAVVTLRVRALSLAGRWREARTVCETYWRDVEHAHDELENLFLQARWSLDEPLGPLLEAAISCLTATEATTHHRTVAAYRALVFADNICDRNSAQSIWDGMRRLPNVSSRVDIAPRLRAEIIYHTSYGDLDTAVSVSNELVEVERSSGDAHTLATALRTASLPHRRAGLTRQAIDLLTESLELSELYHLSTSAASSLDYLASVCLECGNFMEADSYLERLSGYVAEMQDPLLLESIFRLSLKRRLLHGDCVSETEVAKLRPHHDSGRREVEGIAISAMASVLRGEVPDSERFRQLITSHKKTRSHGGQDVVTNFLVCALSFADAGEANTLLNDYVTKHRRERFPLFLSAPLASRGFALPSSATNQI